MQMLVAIICIVIDVVQYLKSDYLFTCGVLSDYRTWQVKKRLERLSANVKGKEREGGEMKNKEKGNAEKENANENDVSGRENANASSAREKRKEKGSEKEQGRRKEVEEDQEHPFQDLHPERGRTQ